MKIACTLLMSVLLLVVQCLGVAPSIGATPTGHSCCPREQAVHCSAACCVAAPAPVSPDRPMPTSDSPVAPRSLLETSALAVLLWSLPSPATLPGGLPPAAGREAGTPPDMPLFLRHAALLI